MRSHSGHKYACHYVSENSQRFALGEWCVLRWFSFMRSVPFEFVSGLAAEFNCLSAPGVSLSARLPAMWLSVGFSSCRLALPPSGPLWWVTRSWFGLCRLVGLVGLWFRCLALCPRGLSG